jgi:hypothetical protein
MPRYVTHRMQYGFHMRCRASISVRLRTVLTKRSSTAGRAARLRVESHSHRVPESPQGLEVKPAATQLDARVRCLLVPAVMVLTGKADRYLPRWLGRLLPRISIEGEEYFRARDELAARKAAAAVPQPRPGSPVGR